MGSTRFSTTGECSPPQHTHTLTHLPSRTCLSPAMLDERRLRTSQGGRGTNHSLHPQPWASFRPLLGVAPPPGRMRADERHKETDVATGRRAVNSKMPTLQSAHDRRGQVGGRTDSLEAIQTRLSVTNDPTGPWPWVDVAFQALSPRANPHQTRALNFHCGVFV